MLLEVDRSRTISLHYGLVQDGQVLEVAEFFYPGDRRGARSSTVDKVLARIRNL